MAHITCPTCDLRFKSVSAFDMHRVGFYETAGVPHSRHCLTPEQMTARGMAHGKHGWAGPPPADNYFAKLRKPVEGE